MKNYEEFVLSRLSRQFHTSRVASYEFSGYLANIIEYGDGLDKIKKALFYGRGEPVTRSDDEMFPKDLGDHPLLEQDMALHGLIGIITEACELAKAIRDSYENGTSLDRVNILEELGDLEWYMQLSRTAMEFSREQVLKANVAKLSKRYETHFTSNEAVRDRDLTAERLILEKYEDREQN